MSDNKYIDRRRFDRFQINDVVLAEIRPCSIIRGPIKNISMTGLAFSYLYPEALVSSAFLEYFEIAILLPGSIVLIDKIPCRTILDYKLDKKYGCMFMQRRTLCAKFGNVTLDLETRLLSFIQKCSCNPLQDHRYVKGSPSESKI
jgi:hypothetical protein